MRERISFDITCESSAKHLKLKKKGFLNVICYKFLNTVMVKNLMLMYPLIYLTVGT